MTVLCHTKAAGLAENLKATPEGTRVKQVAVEIDGPAETG